MAAAYASRYPPQQSNSHPPGQYRQPTQPSQGAFPNAYQRRPPPRCFACDQSGHMAKDCPLLLAFQHHQQQIATTQSYRRPPPPWPQASAPAPGNSQPALPWPQYAIPNPMPGQPTLPWPPYPGQPHTFGPPTPVWPYGLTHPALKEMQVPNPTPLAIKEDDDDPPTPASRAKPSKNQEPLNY